jgi:hypothetical protein
MNGVKLLLPKPARSIGNMVTLPDMPARTIHLIGRIDQLVFSLHSETSTRCE